MTSKKGTFSESLNKFFDSDAAIVLMIIILTVWSVGMLGCILSEYFLFDVVVIISVLVMVTICVISSVVKPKC